MEDVEEVGGKGAALGQLHRWNIPVPVGFVVTTHTHRHFKVHQAFPEEFECELKTHLEYLSSTTYAVRSSATVEDSSAASWAGQFESYLHVQPDDVIHSVKRCWQSVETARVAAYARRRGVTQRDISLAVVVQQMIVAQISGVCFTMHPVTGNRNELFIEAVDGMGQGLVDGTRDPDRYHVQKESVVIFHKTIPFASDSRQRLSDDRILELVGLCRMVEDQYRAPQDIEWTFDGEQFYIVQSRPITACL